MTGSSSGIGYEIAKKIIESGNHVIINGTNKKKLITAQKKLKHTDIFLGDLTKDSSLDKLEKFLTKKKIKIKYLVCNIGGGKPKSINYDSNIQEWIRFFELNFWSTVKVILRLKKYMQKNKASIVCISSICGIEYIKDAPIAYSVAKSSLNSFIKFYSHSQGDFKINGIAPGNIYFKTSSWAKKLKSNKRKIISFLQENVPLARFGDTEDVANLAVYLLSNKAKFINGSVFVVDGGQTRSL